MNRPPQVNNRARGRALYVIAFPIVLLLVAGGAVTVAIVTRNPLLTMPMLLLFFGVARMQRWVFLWLSTRNERSKLMPEREPLAQTLVHLAESQTRQPRSSKRTAHTAPPRRKKLTKDAGRKNRKKSGTDR